MRAYAPGIGQFEWEGLLLSGALVSLAGLTQRVLLPIIGPCAGEKRDLVLAVVGSEHKN